MEVLRNVSILFTVGFFLLAGTRVLAVTENDCEIIKINCVSGKGCGAGGGGAGVPANCTQNAEKECMATSAYLECLSTLQKQSGGEGGNEGGGGSSAAQKYGLQDTAQKAGLPNVGVELPELVGKALAALLGLTATAFFALMIYAGFTWMTAQGNTEKVTTAKNIIINAVLGLVVIALAYAITNFVFKSLG